MLVLYVLLLLKCQNPILWIVDHLIYRISFTSRFAFVLNFIKFLLNSVQGSYTSDSEKLLFREEKYHVCTQNALPPLVLQSFRILYNM